MKSLRAYKASKIVYVILLEISLIVDVVFALSVYEVLKDWFGNLVSLALFAFLLASTLGIILYLLHMWQLEYLTDREK